VLFRSFIRDDDGMAREGCGSKEALCCKFPASPIIPMSEVSRN